MKIKLDLIKGTPSHAYLKLLLNSGGYYVGRVACVDKKLDSQQRFIIHGELLCAMQEYALINNIKWYIGVAPSKLWKYTFLKYDWPVEFLGEPIMLPDGGKISFGKLSISQNILSDIKHTIGIEKAVKVLVNL